MKDEEERKAEWILVQFPDSYSPSNLLTVRAVAAALREAQQDGYTKGWTAGNEHEDELDAEIVKLKAERDELKRDNEEWLRMSKRKDKIIDDAYVRGLEVAKGIAEKYGVTGLIGTGAHASAIIQREIDKAKASSNIL